MAGRKQAVKNAVPKPGHNYFLSHCQDRAIDEAESVSGCCAQGSAVIPWVQRWQANIALLSCSRAGRASAPVVNCFLSHAGRSKKSVVAGYPPLTRFRCSEPKGKLETPNKQQNQSVHKRCSIFLDACQTGHFPNSSAFHSRRIQSVEYLWMENALAHLAGRIIPLLSDRLLQFFFYTSRNTTGGGGG